MMGRSFRLPATARQLVFDYIKDGKRITLKQFLKDHKMQKATFFRYEGEYNLVEKQTTTLTKAEAFEEKKGIYLRAQGIAVPRKTSEEKDEELVLKALKKMAVDDHNASAAKFYLQAIGKFEEKSETKVKLELSAEEHARRNLEAERRLRDSGYGVEEVQKEPPLLSE